MTISVPTPDGRTLQVRVAGPANGLPLVMHHGTPQGAVPFGILERPAAERGIRVVACSRPGYGGSSPLADASTYTVADDVTDTTTILDHLGIDEFITLGWSGGGPRSLACAALLPDRCLAAASGAGVAPFHAEGLDWFDGMGSENHEELGAAVQGVESLERWLTEHGQGLFTATPEQVATALGDLVDHVDRAALTGELAEYLVASGRHAGAQGVVGWRDDDQALVRPWGFDLASIRTPVSVWQGAHDRMVPYAHGIWLADQIPGARRHLYDDEGHLSLIMQMHRVLDDLLDQAGWA
ncbi:MAG TPA: alpha/beta hydrolase [Nocardioidaceae bacterium]|nr:alpha/beta hydrolase [Nocardioidaceae bacterium]